MTTSEVPFGEARAQLRELVCRVGYRGERITITRHGAPAAALVSLDDLRSLEAFAPVGGDPVGPERQTVDETVAVGGSLRDVWNAIARYRERAGWWVDLVVDAEVGGDALISWDERRGRVVDCVDGETIAMRWGSEAATAQSPIEVRIDFVVDDAEVRIRATQVGPGPGADYWRERLQAWKAYVEALSSSVQP
ncbi:type II toxin-antitoxin system prevent-host-death family antitoxin [Rhodococcus hoagii]|nr:type II toxin-antitoxin system prevent-host-death family antitoxin [Prescottella equi]NKS15162.1 type II toxin-antitoxin system prevent-host-death family antitoxin [Prescottella equi]NKS83391.1 type II toxin-antitoxin system prevent-host-death family antitoxin [Prescottella equi]NKS96489.1 type II toxin-antitoxin system prevent-host-death family antitoxin [Prescottella equi]WQB73904.1 type II toxin-antitoxin system prevent-host-death family antitoxin [Prescottella equi]